MTRRTPRLLALEDRLAPAIATWDGGGANNNWMTAANWAGDVAPNPGDDLVFPAGAARLTNTNDFTAGTAFNSISVAGGGYVIGGNSVTLANGVSANFAIGSDSTLDLNVGGAGGLTKAGSGRLILSGDNSYAGITTVSAGILRSQGATALGASGASSETIVLGASVSNFATLELAGGASVAESITLSDNAQLNAINAGVVLAGPVTLTGSTSGSFAGIRNTTNALFDIQQGIGEAGGSHGVNLDGETGGIRFTASSTNTYTGPTNISGIVIFDGQATTSPLSFVTGVVAGTGTLGVANVGFTGLGGALLGRIEPGPGTLGTVGTLTTGNFNLIAGGQFGVDAMSSGIDKLVVYGTVTLGGFLDFRPAAGFAPAIGTHYRLIDNDGTDAVAGKFTRLPEDAVARTINHVALRITYHGGDGNDVELVGDKEQTSLAVGADAGGGPQVNVYGGNGTLLKSFQAYDAKFTGGVRVAVADITGDGIDDIITAPGAGGGPHIKVFDGVTFALVRQFLAYSPAFTGGVFVSAGDVNGDGRADIITGAGAGGGPHVQAFSGTTNAVLASFMAYDVHFTGGVTVTTFSGDIITGAGPGGSPHIRQFAISGSTATPVLEFQAFDPNFRGGVFVATTHGSTGLLGDNLIVSAGAGAGGGPHVKVYSFVGIHIDNFSLTSEFLAYDPAFHGGVRVAGADLDGDGIDELITGPGPSGGPHIKAWKIINVFGAQPTVTSSFLAFDPAFLGGIFVG